LIGFVLDASAAIQLFVFADPDPRLRCAVLTSTGAAPHLLDLEAAQAIRGLVRRGQLAESAGRAALADIAEAPLVRMPHLPLLTRVWELRDAVSAYDASYVALAEMLDAPLLTCDARLAASHGHRAQIDLYGST
jgi:predicted nucleic acid-binding protein